MKGDEDSEKRISKGSIVVSVFVILSTTFFVRASNNMMVTSVPLLARYYFDFSQTEVGIISALSYFFTFLTTSFLNVRLRVEMRRFAFILSNAIYFIVFIGFWKSNLISVWILSAIGGAVLGLLMPNIITAAGLFTDAKVRERVLSMYTVALSLSLVAGPALESYVLRFYPLKTAFLIFSSFAIVSVSLSPFIKFPEERRVKEKVKVFKNYGFRSSILNIMAYNIPFTLLIAFGGIYERDTFGISLSLVTLYFSLFFLSSFASRMFLSFLPPKSIRRQMVASMVLSIIGILIMVLSRSVYLFVVSLVMLGIPHGFTYPLSILSLSRSFEAKERNIANSYFFSVMTAIGIVLPLIGGTIIQKYGFDSTFAGILILIVILMVALNLNFRAERKSGDVENRSVS
ncbi:MAG: MFS transporter [Candidatus Thermoplasmatota archaeon]|nr:MFS transporter [Candidatus Thermoplasmatota archaeon]MCL5789807.1 MFS transporter [Candidatus Thermoplasmatota archaeon]